MPNYNPMVILDLKQFKCIDGLIGKDGIMSKIGLRKRGSAWEYRFQISGTNNKRQYASKGGSRTKKQLQTLVQSPNRNTKLAASCPYKAR